MNGKSVTEGTKRHSKRIMGTLSLENGHSRQADRRADSEDSGQLGRWVMGSHTVLA